ncbi:hypothetical protein M422DRAFT_244125 [Sphaerobolus stellatus SS14]|nr:hypothetical protein M422DRAFT_244125 [Sphaerobolus stellatus SS14]
MPEQQVRFSADTGRNVTSPFRNYGVNSINEAHTPRPEENAPFGQQGTPALSILAQLDGAVVNMISEYSGIQQMVRQAIQNASHEEEPEKSFLAKADVKMGNPPAYSGEHNLEKFKNWVASKVQLQFLGQCLTDEAQEWFYRQVERFDREIKYWDLESIMMGLQKWFMPGLSLNKVAVSSDRIIELVLRKGFTAEFSKIDELMEQAVTLDNAKHYTSGYNSNHGSSYVHKTAAAEHSHAQHMTTQSKSSNPNAGSSNQHKSGSNTVQNRLTTQLLLTGGKCES